MDSFYSIRTLENDQIILSNECTFWQVTPNTTRQAVGTMELPRPPIKSGHCRCGCGNKLPKSRRPSVTCIQGHHRRRHHYAELRRYVVARYLAGDSLPKLSLILGVSVNHIKRTLLDSNIKLRERGRRGGKYDAALQERVAALYKSGHSIPMIHRETGISSTEIQRILRKKNVERRPPGRHRFQCRDNAFSIITTESQAYWLGMLATDGNINQDRIKLGLSIRDRKHIDLFCAFMGTKCAVVSTKSHTSRTNDGRIINGGPQSVIAFRSKQVASDLARHGILPNKTYTIRPWNGPPHLMRHYWRGVIDGDGSVSDGSTRKERDFAMTLCGTLPMCRGLRAFLKEHAGTSSSITKSGNIYHLQVGGIVRTKAAVRLLYDGCSIALERKLMAAHNILKDSRRNPKISLTFTKRQLLALIRLHKTWKAVARELGVHQSTIRNAYTRLGIDITAPYFMRGKGRPGTSWCRICKKFRAKSKFWVDRHSMHGVTRECKDCYRDRKGITDESRRIRRRPKSVS